MPKATRLFLDITRESQLRILSLAQRVFSLFGGKLQRVRMDDVRPRSALAVAITRTSMLTSVGTPTRKMR
jgi:hypothetical protein